MCELIIGARYKRGSKRESSIIHWNLFFFSTQHSLRRRQLSVTRQDKTLISRNQISTENRDREEGQRNQQKTAETLLWMSVRDTLQQRMFLSLICHVSFCLSLFSHSVAALSILEVSFLSQLHSLLAAWHYQHDLVMRFPSHTQTHTFSCSFSLSLVCYDLCHWLMTPPLITARHDTCPQVGSYPTSPPN